MLTKLLYALSFLCLTTPAFSAMNVAGGSGNQADVALKRNGDHFVLENGNLRVEINGATSGISSIRFHNHEFVEQEDRHRQIYWSMDGGSFYQTPSNALCTVKSETTEMVDVGCKEKYSGNQPHALDIDIHYVLRRGATGIYTYAVLTHPESYPETSVGEWRVVWQTPHQGSKWLLENIYVDAIRHWETPSPEDISQELHTPIKEISIFRSGRWKGQAESKYTYNANYEDIHCFGFASDKNQIGAWTVLGGYDYYNDGPLKQDLTALDGGMTHHLGRNHYGGSGIHIAHGESWSKIFGPFLLYLNAGSSGDSLWHDAQHQAEAEQAAWPYSWLDNTSDYPSRKERGSLQGKFSISDSSKPTMRSANSWIGLVPAAAENDFQMESKGYQYWSRVRQDETFSIRDVRPGDYTLYAFSDGEVGQYNQKGITIHAGKISSIAEVTWKIPRQGRKLIWEIGTPDRDTKEFRHGSDYFLPYLYKTFALEFPNPLIYTIGGSLPSRDWNYAQGSYRKPDSEPVLWPWEIHFKMDHIPSIGSANLILAIAGANRAHIVVNVNGHNVSDFTPAMNQGNALLRQGSHAKYSIQNIPVPLQVLHSGDNVIQLLQTSYKDDSSYVSYDYVGFEMPDSEVTPK